MTSTIILAITEQDVAEIKVSQKNLLSSFFCGFSVAVVTTHMINAEMIAATAGATNQLDTITESFYHLMFEEPSVAIPQPMRAPTTVWVPDIGIPNTEEHIMNKKDEMQVPSIIFSAIE